MTPTTSRIITLGTLALLSLVACADELEGTTPPRDVFYFPIGLEISENGRYAYVVSSNFDLRFNAGWLSVVDLESSVVASGDVVDPRAGLVIDQLLVPSLGGTIGRNGDRQFFVAHRTDRLISVLELSDDGRDVSCGVPDAPEQQDELTVDERRTDCDRDHLFKVTAQAATEASSVNDSLSDFDVGDPFSVLVVEPENQPGPILLAGQLARARLNALEVTAESPFLEFGVDDDGNLRGRSELLASNGRFNDLVTVPGTNGRFLAAAGFLRPTAVPRAALIHVNLDNYLSGGDRFSVTLNIGSEVGGCEFAKIAFDPEGRYAYATVRVADRDPRCANGSVVRMDATIERLEFLDERGERDFIERPRYEVDAQTTLSGQPSGMIYLDRPEGDLLAVSDINEDAIYILDPLSTEMPVLSRIDVPGGPFTLRAAEIDGRPSIVTTLFFSHGLGIIDATGSASEFRLNTIVRNGDLGVGERAR